MSNKTVIADYGTGNLRSIWRALNRAGVAAEVSSERAELASADKIILPGVGNFGRAMSGLRRRGMIDALNEAVLERHVPVLGICLGLELMGKGSEESGTAGLGWLDAGVVKFRPADARHKVPYIGWNGIEKKREARLLAGLNGTSEFYFLHSYYLAISEDDAVAAMTTYEQPFPSVIEKGNIFGVQFHPERSHGSGQHLLKNFLSL